LKPASTRRAVERASEEEILAYAKLLHGRWCLTRRLRLLSLIAVAASCLLPSTADAQQPPAPSTPPIRVFIDCNNTPCDAEFFRTEITFVDQVRERQDADVHLLMTGQPTGSGGREITFSFFGQGRFMGRDHVLRDTFVVAASDDEVRRGMVRVMSLGLVPYVLETDAADRLSITVAAPSDTAAQVAGDPWNRWSLRFNLNGNASGEASSTFLSVNTNFNANRTTEASKINLNTRMNYRQSRFELPDGRSFLSPNRDYGANGQYVKSLGEHWSAGVRANWGSSSFNNQDYTWFAGPAVEWDLFPYSESTRRLLTLLYSVGVRAWNYEQETIYGKLEEVRATHNFDTTVSLRQRWGTIGSTVSVASFIPDLAKNHVSLFGNVSLNLFRGLALNLNTNIESLRDQITLPREEATSEEVLVNQRQLATSYRYFVFFGVSYTFGSIFSPIVNPRFGG
jgi:hypothetical protein